MELIGFFEVVGKKREVELFWLAIYFFLRTRMATMIAMRITIVATMM